MTESGMGASERVAVTANRLRMVQVDFADRPAHERKQFLDEELRRGLAGVEPDRRQAFLDELRELFPAWAGATDVADLENVPSAGAGELGESVVEMARKVARRLHELSPEERQDMAEMFAFAGLTIEGAESGGGGLDEAALAPLREMLSIGPGKPIETARLVELVTLLVQFTGSVHQLTWSTWRAIAPHSAIRRSGNLQKLMAMFLSGELNGGAAAVQADVDRLRQLVASLISAIGQVGRQFATGHLARFAPAEIESAVASESSGSWWSKGGREARHWRKYVELAESRDAAAIEAEIRDVIVSHTEQLLKRVGQADR